MQSSSVSLRFHGVRGLSNAWHRAEKKTGVRCVYYQRCMFVINNLSTSSTASLHFNFQVVVESAGVVSCNLEDSEPTDNLCCDQ